MARKYNLRSKYGRRNGRRRRISIERSASTGLYEELLQFHSKHGRKNRVFLEFEKLSLAEETAACNRGDDEELASIETENDEGSFNWRPYLRKSGFSAAPVSGFKHVALSSCWQSLVLDVKVEVRSPDCKTCCVDTDPCSYWIATVIKVCGYWGLLRYEGCDKTSPQYFNVSDKWINLCTEPHIHPIGWCTENNQMLVPPKSIEPKIICWKAFLMDMLPGGRTIPADFSFRIQEHTHNSIKKGMKLEVVDKNLISVVRSALVTEVVGGRLHIVYAENEAEEDEGFWCHERSPLIHPVGWAQIIGHALKARPEYARQSLKKTIYRTFEPNDATWDMFLPVYNPVSNLKFKKGMKLEAIDPLNLSTICVATVTEVLRNNYLMIGIDGMMAANGADCFCYHASSPCIFPVGFCDTNEIALTPPRGFKEVFKWSEYLKKTKSEAAPVDLFRKDIPDHGFKEGMFLEAVDLMEPRLVCVAYVTKVVGRLLRVHFDGWEEDYDQWCDCESPDLFPIGWCEVLGYRLEPPRVDVVAEELKKKKKPIVRRRKRKPWSKRPSSSEDSPIAEDERNSSKNAEATGPSQDKNIITLDDSSSNSTPAGKRRGRRPRPKAPKTGNINPVKNNSKPQSSELPKNVESVETATPKASQRQKILRSQRLAQLENTPESVQRKRKHRACVKSVPTIISDDDFSSGSLDDPEFKSATSKPTARKTIQKALSSIKVNKVQIPAAETSSEIKGNGGGRPRRSGVKSSTFVTKNDDSSLSSEDDAVDG